MPNWVFNTLSITGDRTDLEGLANKLNTPITTYHTDFVYESTEEFPRKVKKDENGNAVRETVVTHYSNPVFSFMNVVAPTNLEAYYGEEVFKKVDTSNPDGSIDQDKFMAEFVRSMSEDNDWYHWNVRNWGTKWDIAVRDNENYPDTTLEVDDEDGSLLYRFNTAWSPVHEVIEILTEEFPTLTFSYYFEEEQGWGGEVIVKAGDILESREWDIPSSHADYKALDRECACEYEDYEYAYPDCPVDKTKYRYDDDLYGWVEIEMSDPSAMITTN